MKRLIAAVLLLIFVAGAYTANYLYINDVCKKTEMLLEECVSAYEKGEQMKASTERLEEYWSDREDMLSVLANHGSIDEIEHAIHSLSVHSNYENNEMFYEYSGTVKILLHQLKEDTVPGIHSIF